MDQLPNESRLEHWNAVIQEANSSGMSRSAWCAEHGIPLQQFYRWQRKVRASVEPDTPNSIPEKNSGENSGAIFFEIPALPMERSRGDIPFTPEMVLRYGRFQVLISGDVSENALTTVLTALTHV